MNDTIKDSKVKIILDGDNGIFVDENNKPLPKEFYDILIEEVQKELSREILRDIKNDRAGR